MENRDDGAADDRLRRRLQELSSAAPVLPLDLGHVTAGVHRRRGHRRAAQAGAAMVGIVVVAAGIGVGLQPVADHGGRLQGPGKSGPYPPPTSGQSASAPSAASTTTATPDPGPSTPAGDPGTPTPVFTRAAAVGERSYACGGSVSAPVDAGGTRGAITYAASAVPDPAGGPPTVTLSLRASKPVSLVVPPGRPRVLVLDRDGRVVAGQDGAAAAPGPNNDLVARATTVDPAHPYSTTLPPLAGTPCDGRTWADLTAPAAGYDIAVVVHDRDYPYPAATAPANGLVPVLVARATLSR